MFGIGPPANPQARRRWWRRQIERQAQSNLTVAEFCRRSGVSTVTFYSWKRRFRDAPAAAAAIDPKRQPAPSAGSGRPSTPVFVPVSIRDSTAIGQLEIELANACTVRLKGAVDPKLLRAAIRAAGRLGGTGKGAD
jgi:transposase-like protein